MKVQNMLYQSSVGYIKVSLDARRRERNTIYFPGKEIQYKSREIGRTGPKNGDRTFDRNRVERVIIYNFIDIYTISILKEKSVFMLKSFIANLNIFH